MSRQFSVVILLTIIFFICNVGLSTGLTITDLHGDKDGFGFNVAPGDGFDALPIIFGDIDGDGDGTDFWMFGTYSHAFSIDFSSFTQVTSVTLEVFSGGQGQYGLSEVYLDGFFLGTLTDGDGVGPLYNYAWLDTFDITPFITQVTNNPVLSILTQVGHDGRRDGWVVDYTELTVTGEQTPVPEPATLVLFGTGLLGIFRYSKKHLSE